MKTKKIFIAKPEWFTRRKYLGWGVGIKTWQGVVYTAAIVGLFIVSNALQKFTNGYSLYFGGAVLFIFIIDIFYVMMNLNYDERERVHEAIAERNALWGIMAVLVAGILFESIYYGLQNKVHIDPFIAGALIVGTTIKSITNYKLGKEN